MEPPPCCIWHDRELSWKILKACRVARKAGYKYLWIDSCCINKDSSSELSEAINSMYLWYQTAAVCYAFLDDTRDNENPSAPRSSFRKSRWWTRGWTLQELIAPKVVIFLSKSWRFIGTKHSLASLVEEICGVDRAVLVHERALDDVVVPDSHRILYHFDLMFWSQVTRAAEH